MRTFLMTVALVISTTGAAESSGIGSFQDGSLGWVRACAARLPLEKTLRIDGEMHELCRKPNYYYSSPTHFLISNKGNALAMEYKIRFTILPKKTTTARAKELLDLARSCVPDIQAVWRRYGVELDVPMDSNRHPSSIGNNLPSMSVNLYDQISRGNAQNFYLREDRDSFCKMVVHEIGHHFALEDEYADPQCPDRPFISQEMDPYSLMAYIFADWNNMDFFERHVRTVFGEFCGEPRTKAVLPKDWVNLGLPE